STPGEEVAALPLARVEAGRSLPLGEGANPAWAARLQALKRDVVAQVVGKRHDIVTEAEWHTIKEKLARYEAWLAAKKGAPVEKLGRARAQALLGGGGKAKVAELIAKDLSLAA